MDVAVGEFDAGDVVVRDARYEVLGEPVFADGAADAGGGIDHEGVAGEEFGAEVIVALDTVLFTREAALVAVGVADAVQAEARVVDGVEPRDAGPIAGADDVVKALGF